MVINSCCSFYILLLFSFWCCSVRVFCFVLLFVHSFVHCFVVHSLWVLFIRRLFVMMLIFLGVHFFYISLFSCSFYVVVFILYVGVFVLFVGCWYSSHSFLRCSFFAGSFCSSISAVVHSFQLFFFFDYCSLVVITVHRFNDVVNWWFR